jgi:hypothetical protein
MTRQFVNIEVLFVVTMLLAMIGPVVEYLVR